MASWAALNAGERDVGRAGALGRATEEAQDAQNTSLYEQALRFQQQKQVRASDRVRKLLMHADEHFLDVVSDNVLAASICCT